MQAQFEAVLESAAGLDGVHMMRLLRLLGHQGDKYGIFVVQRVALSSPSQWPRFFLSEVQHAVKAGDNASAVELINGVTQQNTDALSTVPLEVRASLVTAVRLLHLHQVFKSLSAPQLLALHRAVGGATGREQVFQVLSGLQKLLSALPPRNLQQVHYAFQDAGPDADMRSLSQMLGVPDESFFLAPPMRQVLSLDFVELKGLRDALSGFSAAHVGLVVDLLQCDNFDALELRALFVPLILDEPEAYFGGGFALGLSGDQVICVFGVVATATAHSGAADDSICSADGILPPLASTRWM
jgi:hypothetical protein